MNTGDLCYVRGSIECGRIVAIYVAPGRYDEPAEWATIEMPGGRHEIEAVEITRTWPPATIGTVVEVRETRFYFEGGSDGAERS